MKGIIDSVSNDSVASIGTSIEACRDIIPVGQYRHQLSLALVAPLRAEHDHKARVQPVDAPLFPRDLRRLGQDIVVFNVLLQATGELIHILDGAEHLDFIALDRVNSEGELGDLVHGFFEDAQLVFDEANVILHFPDCFDAADEHAVVFEEQRLDIVLLHFRLLVNFAVRHLTICGIDVHPKCNKIILNRNIKHYK